jgi:hypothetical protein
MACNVWHLCYFAYRPERNRSRNCNANDESMNVEHQLKLSARSEEASGMTNSANGFSKIYPRQ